MNDRIAGRFDEALANLPDYLGQHILISVVALAIGIGVSLPLAIYAVRSSWFRMPLLTLASVVQTIPSIALLALFYPLLLGLSALTTWAFGFGFSALGFLPTILALTLYSMLPIVRNTVTGIEGLDPAVLEAARGIGMTPRQSLWRVELPLALPVIIAGVRTSTVWVVGIATLSTPVGQTSLGNYIFTGLQTKNWTSVLFGCILAAILALLLDQLIALLESAATKRTTSRALAALAGLIIVIGGGLAPALYRPTADVVIGAKSFTEQFILADVIRRQLDDENYTARVREGLGSAVIFDALAADDIQVYVDYTGTIWANAMQRTETPSAETVLDEMTAWVQAEHGILCLGPLGFENAYGLAMKRERAEALNITTIDDLARHAPDLSIGGDFEFFGRPEWEAIRSTYGLEFAERQQYQSTFMYSAVDSGDVDVISAFTSDGRIAAYDLVVLDDPRQAIPPYDAVLLLSPQAAADPVILRALRPLIGAIDDPAMREANRIVDVDGESIGVAAEFLRGEIDDDGSPGP